MPPKQLSVDDLQDEDLYNFLEIGEKANNKQVNVLVFKKNLKQRFWLDCVLRF